MGMSLSHLLIILLIILVLFGAGKLPQVMADLAKGLKAFKDGMQNNNDSKKE
jgi:sec-independent protein translocase protein TatA